MLKKFLLFIISCFGFFLLLQIFQPIYKIIPFGEFIFIGLLYCGFPLIGYFVFKGRSSGQASNAGTVSEFNADYRHPSIAIDMKNKKVWLRDMSGKSAIFDKSDILRWETLTRDQMFSRNFILRCHVKSFDKPFYDVLITSCSTKFGLSSAENELSSWFSRLTSWVNNAD